MIQPETTTQTSWGASRKRAQRGRFTPNAYRIEGDAAYITLSRGDAIIDTDLLEMVLSFGRWAATSNGYVCDRRIRDGKKSSIYLHRFIAAAPADMDVDHINHNGLDNRRQNLRLVTKSENLQNRFANRISSAGVKNVFFDATRGRYRVEVGIGGRRVTRGTFATVEEAAEIARQLRISLHSHCPENSGI